MTVQNEQVIVKSHLMWGDGRKGDIWVRESLVESINRRLSELGISRSQMASALNISKAHVSDVLNERKYGSLDIQMRMLHFVGMEVVAIPDLIQWRGADGHWFYGERCQYCGVNMYDTEAVCPNPKNGTRS